MNGKFITLEGIEGAGKSTAMQVIADYLTQQGISFILTREPGGTEIAEAIRQLLLQPHHEVIHEITELLLMFAARNQHVKVHIEPHLAEGKWVISDRYIDASYAYQGGGRNISENILSMLDQLIHCPYPDLTLLLDLPIALGLSRQKNRGQGQDRIEREQENFFFAVRSAYLKRAQKDSQRIKVIDASVDPAQVKKQIEQQLSLFIASPK